MMVGYVINNDGGCYRKWNPKTNYIFEPRYVIWLQRKCFPQNNVTP